MGFLALLLVGLAAWLIWTGRLQRLTGTDGVMLGLAIVGAILAARGKPIIGGIPLGIALLHLLRRMKTLPAKSAHRPNRPTNRRQTNSAAIIEARALLGLDPCADAAAIRAAHRRLIARNHPDAGGTQALAEKINQARDLLLRHAAEQGSAPAEP
jgi:hypothetical protein